MPLFNGGQPLKVIRVSEDSLGIVDFDMFRVWIEHSITSVDVPGWRGLPQISIPKVPATFGRWNQRFIGGLSKTMRLSDVVRSLRRHGTDIVLFAVRCPDVDGLAKALAEVPFAWKIVRDDEHYGDACEVVKPNGRGSRGCSHRKDGCNTHVRRRNKTLIERSESNVCVECCVRRTRTTTTIPPSKMSTDSNDSNWKFS